MEICAKAKQLIDEDSQQRNAALCQVLEACESPIEQILLVALFARWNADANVHLKPKRIQCLLTTNHPSYNGIFTVCCEPQKTVVTRSGERYRVDFYLYLTRFGSTGASVENNHCPELAKLVIEVDGHDFHDRTKRQASRDRARDRHLLLEGSPCIRFTGSDVYHEPDRCAEEVHDTLDEMAYEVFRTYLEQDRLVDLICGRQ